MKHRNLIKRWIIWIRTSQIFRCLISNYLVWHQRNIFKINQMFLAIKFKIRFRLKFEKQFGSTFHERQRRLIRRAFNFANNFQRDGMERQAKEIVVSTLYKAKYILKIRRRVAKFFENVHSFQKLLKMAYIRKAMKKEFLSIVVERELQDLVFAYQKQQLFPKKTK